MKTHNPATWPMKSAPMSSANGETARRSAPRAPVVSSKRTVSEAEDAEDRQAEQDRIDEERGADEPAGGQKQREAGRIDAAPAGRVEEDVLAPERIRDGRRSEPQAARREDLALESVRDSVGHVRDAAEDTLSEKGAHGGGEQSEPGREKDTLHGPGLRRRAQSPRCRATTSGLAISAPACRFFTRPSGPVTRK